MIRRRERSIEVFSSDPYWDYLVRSEGLRKFEYKKALFPFELSEKLSFFHLQTQPPLEPFRAGTRAARRLNRHLFTLDPADSEDVLDPEYALLFPAKKRWQDVTHRSGRRVIFLL